MRRLLLVKYAPEIFLKGLNRGYFEKKLKSNIKAVLNGMQYEFITDQGRWFLYSDDYEEMTERMKKVFGISEICVVSEVDNDLEAINQAALNEIKDIKPTTFKIETNRANKNFPMNSLEVSRKVGAYVLTNYKDISVDVNKPECTINVEIRDRAYVYGKRIKGTGGLPYGINGSTMLMLSGGIDSPVAGYMMARRGVQLSCIYYHSHPYTSERAKDKVKTLAGILKKYTGEITLYVAPFTNIQMEIINKCREDELTIIMRRFMMRVACTMAENLKIQSVTSGESIGQVASQTMESMVVTDNTADRPVFRPLVSMDKLDIINIAEKIDTYETSILPYEDCCTVFVPKHPKTKPRLCDILKSEEALDIDGLVKDCIDNIEVIKI
jgi:thiamine biosynthesis protein ThiI